MVKKIVGILVILTLFWFVLKRDTLNEVKRIAFFGKIWGLLKYHHPEVKKGIKNWDEVFVKYYEKVKKAEDFEAFNKEITGLISEAGISSIPFLNFSLNQQFVLSDDFSWIKDETILNDQNSVLLERIKLGISSSSQYYVTSVRGVGNTQYNCEERYFKEYPSEEYRVLAVCRFWNIIEYFFPYKGDIGEDWNNVLIEYIPQIRKAENAMAYHLLIRQFTARINDGHCFMKSSELNSYFGKKRLPYFVRDVEGESVITRDFSINGKGNLKVGDIIRKVNDENVEDRRKRLRQYVFGSNEPGIRRNINSFLLIVKSDTVTVTVERDGEVREITCTCPDQENLRVAFQNLQNTGEKWKLLEGNIGYVNMDKLKPRDVDLMMEEFKETRGIVFDIRNYPKGTLYKIADHLYPEKKDFVKFTAPDLQHPGTFFETRMLSLGKKNSNNYKGKVVVLMDERTQSHAEFTVMMFQALPECTVIGSQTAGADGNVSRVWLPGNIEVWFTGLGVYYPDGRKTQRVGLSMDIELKPTIKGIRAGRDELLEKAIEVINR